MFDSTNKKITLTGQFVKVLAGGDLKNWAFALVLFRSDNNEQYPVYMTNTKIELNFFYEVELIPSKTRKNNYQLVSFKVSQVSDNKQLELLLIRNVKGLGIKTLDKLNKIYNNEFFKSFCENPEEFQTVLKSDVYESLLEFSEKYNGSYEFFVKHNLTNLYTLLEKYFGKKDYVKYYSEHDPYELFIDYHIDFKMVDLFAQKLANFNLKNQQKAFIYFIFRKLSMMNNTLIHINDIFKLFEEEYKQEKDVDQTFYQILTELIETGEMYFDKNDHLFALNELRQKELYIYKTIMELLNFANEEISYPLTSSSLSNDQQEAFHKALMHNISIISGFPGTGKSYLIEHIHDALINTKYQKNEIEILTPTGKSGSNLKVKSGLNVKTIHSFLRLSKDDDYILQPLEDLEKTKVLIIDEFSMVNTYILYLILKHVINVERIIFIGDFNQLPCIGPGNFIHDMIMSNKIPFTILNEIYRTDKQDICDHFLSIKNNSEPKLITENVQFIDTRKEEFNNVLINNYYDLVEKYGIEQTYALIPIYRGEVGIDNANKILQSWYLKYTQNNSRPIYSMFKKQEEINFYLGDKVVQLVNDYDKNVFNGEIGFIVDSNDKNITVKFDNNKFIEYLKNDIRENLTLAYALSVHKFQGSESDGIIIPIFKDYDFMLTKKLMYTAVSRAKEKLILFGDSTLYVDKILHSTEEAEIKTSFAKFFNE